MSNELIPKYLKKFLKREWDEFAYFAKDMVRLPKEEIASMGQTVYAEFFGLECGVPLKKQFKNYADFLNEGKIPLMDKIKAHVYPCNAADLILLMGGGFAGLLYLTVPIDDKKPLLDDMRFCADVYLAITPIRMLNCGTHFNDYLRNFFNSSREAEVI